MVNLSIISFKVIFAFLVLETKTGLPNYNRIDYLYALIADITIKRKINFFLDIFAFKLNKAHIFLIAPMMVIHIRLLFL